MKKRRKKNRKKEKQKFLRIPLFDFGLTVTDYLYLMQDLKKYPKAKLYVDIHGGGPILKVMSCNFYPKGIEGKPSFILQIENINDPKHTSFEQTLTSQIIAFLRLIAKGK